MVWSCFWPSWLLLCILFSHCNFHHLSFEQRYSIYRNLVNNVKVFSLVTLTEINKKCFIRLISLLGCLASQLRLNSHLGFSDNNARYEHLARSAPAILDDSLSADSYLNVLYMPSTFPRSERSRRSQEALNDSSSNNTHFEDGPKSNLDSVRYLECINYFQEVSLFLPRTGTLWDYSTFFPRSSTQLLSR